MYSRGVEDPEDEEDPADTQDEETEDDDIQEVPAPLETHVQLRSARQQVKKEPLKRVLTVDVKGFPYGNYVKAYEEDIRKIAKELDPNYNYKEQLEVMRTRFLNRLAAGKIIGFMFECFVVFRLHDV